ncbi:TPA: calcium:sodium antiporter, partial [Candidatus Bipolaricaulota bacterium]|nr:calcium:sodium antiporter [Candidatus Bipolaricaulota bacterium]
MQVVLFIIGLILLYFGAEGLVRGSSNLARALRIRPVIIGLTVVAFGTSAPELVVSLLAAARESEALAVGNVVGS